ncbi:hypothetical protein XENTR_v10010559 [Xenopus tropicalis]|nr:hypothetical protein XENTR_v10010559 [Xenopus tropicalis]
MFSFIGLTYPLINKSLFPVLFSTGAINQGGSSGLEMWAVLSLRLLLLVGTKVQNHHLCWLERDSGSFRDGADEFCVGDLELDGTGPLGVRQRQVLQEGPTFPVPQGDGSVFGAGYDAVPPQLNAFHSASHVGGAAQCVQAPPRFYVPHVSGAIGVSGHEDIARQRHRTNGERVSGQCLDTSPRRLVPDSYGGSVGHGDHVDPVGL